METVYVFAGTRTHYETWTQAHLDPKVAPMWKYVESENTLRGLAAPVILVVLSSFWIRKDVHDILACLAPNSIIFHPIQLIVSMEDYNETMSIKNIMSQVMNGTNAPVIPKLRAKTPVAITEPVIIPDPVFVEPEQPGKKKIHFNVIKV